MLLEQRNQNLNPHFIGFDLMYCFIPDRPLNLTMGDALRDLIPFLQFKKREKYSWSRVTFSEVVG